MTKRILFSPTIAIVLATALTSRAAQTASDNAADPAYASGWSSGENGGSGFAPWNIIPDSGAGAIIASSSINGASPPSGNIDSDGVSWGLYSSTSNFITATRPLTGDLSVGQQILCDFDNGSIGTGGVVELLLLSGSATRFTWLTEGGDYYYFNNTGNTNVETNTDIASVSNGLHLDFTLTGTNTFSLAVTPAGQSTRTFTGDLEGSAGGSNDDIDEIQFLVDDAGAPPDADAFINNLAVIPEPGCLACVAGGALILLRRRHLAACQINATLMFPVGKDDSGNIPLAKGTSWVYH